MRAGRWLALCLALACHAAAARAGEGELVTHLALLELETEGVQDDLARQLGDALRREISATDGHTLSDARVSLAQLSLVQDCDPSQASCVARIARQLGVGGLVYGKLTNEGSGAYCEIKLFDVTTQREARVARSMFALRDASDGEVERKAAQLVDQLLERAAPAPAPPPNGAAPVVEQELQVEAAASPGVSGKRVAGYALLGGAALSAGLSVLAFVEIDRAQNNESLARYRRAVGSFDPEVQDVCDEAKAERSHGVDAVSFSEVKSGCSTGRTFEVLQYVFLGAAAISGGLSAYFLLSEDERRHQRSALTDLPVRPIVRANAAELRARFKF